MIHIFYYLLILVVASIIDAVYHLVLLGKPYKEVIAAMNVGTNFSARLLPALGAQVVMIAAIYALIYLSNVNGLQTAAILGALAGTLAITVYGLTNYSLFKNWSLSATLYEIVWGPVFGAFLGVLAFYLQSLVK